MLNEIVIGLLCINNIKKNTHKMFLNSNFSKLLNLYIFILNFFFAKFHNFLKSEQEFLYQQNILKKKNKDSLLRTPFVTTLYK